MTSDLELEVTVSSLSLVTRILGHAERMGEEIAGPVDGKLRAAFRLPSQHHVLRAIVQATWPALSEAGIMSVSRQLLETGEATFTLPVGCRARVFFQEHLIARGEYQEAGGRRLPANRLLSDKPTQNQ